MTKLVAYYFLAMFLILATARLADAEPYLYTPTKRDAGYPLVLRDVSLEYKSFFDGGSYPLITDNGLNRVQDKEMQLNLNFDLLSYLYWDNVVHASTDRDPATGSSQFRLVGWQFGLGVRLTEWLKVGYYHHSQHLLDATLPWRFPVQDALHLQIKVYSSGNVERSLF